MEKDEIVKFRNFRIDCETYSSIDLNDAKIQLRLRTIITDKNLSILVGYRGYLEIT